MKQELVRINSIDGIEQPGVLHSLINSKSCSRIKWRFLDTLAKSYTDKNYAS